MLLVLPEQDATAAAAVAERIRAQLCDTPVAIGNHAVRVTASVGVACASAGETADALLNRADTAL